MAGRGKIIKSHIAEKLSLLKCSVKLNEPLSKHTSLAIGGNAKFFVEVDTVKQLTEILKFATLENIKIFILGGGTNVLFDDEDFDGIVIKLCGDFCKINFSADGVLCGSGVNLSYLAKQAIDRSLGGLEYFATIPGTVGGAVSGNAGVKGIDISSVIKSVEVIDYNGNIEILNAESISFGYRTSGLKNVVITAVNFILKKADKNDMLKTVSQEIEKRKNSQPIGTKNAGCIFKNPQGKSAGQLIDSLGLKGYAFGDIEISTVHANFFVNKGSATAREMTAVIDLVKDKVKENFNINLETEIKIIK